jgi:hypothetical protein
VCLEAAEGRCPFVLGGVLFVVDDIVARLGAIVQDWLMDMSARDFGVVVSRTTGISSPVQSVRVRWQVYRIILASDDMGRCRGAAECWVRLAVNRKAHNGFWWLSKVPPQYS